MEHSSTNELLGRITKLQQVRDELVEANDELVAAVGELRREMTARSKSPAPEAGASTSRFAKFMEDMVDKRQEESKALQSAAARGDAAALAASQLNVRLLQEALRKAEAAGGGASGSACERCGLAEARAAATQKRLDRMEDAMAKKTAEFNAALAELAAGKAGAEQTLEELAAKCSALQEAVEEAAANAQTMAARPSPPSARPNVHSGSTVADADLDFDFDEFGDPAPASRRDRTGQSGAAEGSFNGGASHELLQVALADVKHGKSQIEMLQRKLTEEQQTWVKERETLVSEHTAALSEAQSRAEAEQLRAQTLAERLAHHESAAEGAREALGEAKLNEERLVAEHERQLRQRDTTLKELRATLARKSPPPVPVAALARSASSTSTDTESSPEGTTPFGGGGHVDLKALAPSTPGPRHPPSSTGAQSPSPSLRPDAASPPLPAAAGLPNGARAATTTPQRGTFGKLRGLFGGGSSVTSTTDLKSAPVQKLRALLEETLQENLRLEARVAELESVTSKERMHL